MGAAIMEDEMNNGERDALVMRHLERAYRASCGHDNKGRGDNEVEGAVLEAIAILHRRRTTATR